MLPVVNVVAELKVFVGLILVVVVVVVALVFVPVVVAIIIVVSGIVCAVVKRSVVKLATETFDVLVVVPSGVLSIVV